MGKSKNIDAFEAIPDEKQDRSEFIAEAAEYLVQYFKPAHSLQEASELLTTEEVYLAIKRLNPSTKVEFTDIFAMMEQNGFTFTPDPTLFTFEFKWLLIRKA